MNGKAKAGMKKIRVLLAACCLIALAGCQAGVYRVDYTYDVDVGMMFDSGEDVLDRQRQMAYSLMLMPTCVDMLNSGRFVLRVAEELDKEDRSGNLSRRYGFDELMDAIDAHYEADAMTYIVSVTLASPDDAVVVSDVIAALSDSFIAEYVTGSAVTVKLLDAGAPKKTGYTP